MTGQPSMVAAFGYLQFNSLVNNLKQRVRRLRQPKYLFGFIVGAAYLYFFMVRRLFHASAAPGGILSNLPAGMAAQLAAIAALILLVIVMLAWLLPNDRAALRFTEAEVAFLFPAPLSRLSLINFSLLRSQLAIFFSAFIMSLLLRRGAPGGNAWQHAGAIWMLLATLKLHFLGASFTRERLLDLGVRPALRRVLVLAVVLIIGGLCWWWMRGQLRAPDRDALANPGGLFAYVGMLLATPPLGWLLLPFKLIAAPLFASDTGSWLRAAGPAFALVALHYFWVVRSQVSFEEASIDLARKRAERSAAMRAGNSRFGRAPSKPRSEPFVLAATGHVPIAFLWKGLIAAGPLWRPRSWLVACVVIVAGSRWLASDPNLQPVLPAIAGVAAMLGAWLFLIGPMFVQRGLRDTVDQLDILKSSPLHGWQIALGQLLTPVLIITGVQWLLLLLAMLCFRAEAGATLWTYGNVFSAGVGLLLMAPPLCALMLCVPFAGLLYFPAWTATIGARNGGFEVMGQRMIFMGAYIGTLLVALLPAALVGGLCFLLLNWSLGLAVALLGSSVVAAVVISGELAGAVYWLGRRIDAFDVSLESR